MSLPTVLVIDEDLHCLKSFAESLQGEFDIKTASSIDTGRTVLEQEWVQVVICERQMPDISGVDFLKEIKAQWPEVIRIILSDNVKGKAITQAINEADIYHHITKPWDIDALILTLKNAVQLFHLQREKELLTIELKAAPKKRELNPPQYSDGIIRGEGSIMDEVCDKLLQVAPFDISVLITGESGTGKELAARALHYNSLRWDKPFVVENCGALPDELLESELFGYKKGAFTGAIEDRIGFFERADGGTVFLDEIGEVSPAFQVKLLRVLQEGEIRPLGCSTTRKVNVRVIAATNRNLEEDVRAGRFREDLYYRLTSVTIDMPALRERRSDIPVVARSLLEVAINQLGKQVQGFSDEAIACMQHYHWPGNVRELQNEIQHMLVMARSKQLGADLLSPKVLHAAPKGQEVETALVADLDGTLKDRMEALEARIVKGALIRHRWNKSRAAKELGLSRVGLRNKLERYGLEKVELVQVCEEAIV